jgi:hypothetical protein
VIRLVGILRISPELELVVLGDDRRGGDAFLMVLRRIFGLVSTL